MGIGARLMGLLRRTPPPPAAASGSAHVLPGALRHPLPAPPAEAAPRRRGPLALVLRGGGDTLAKCGSSFDERMQAGSIVFYAAREEYSVAPVPTSTTDDIRERIFRLLEAADTTDVLTPIMRLPSDARARLVDRLQAYGTYEALRLVADIADRAAVTPAA
ncbi:MAG: hypothetical protein SF182_01645 [Deltaproteobacteria bacterium]|nr:hypothetical protein [Deltaproteobacteria bacterium]